MRTWRAVIWKQSVVNIFIPWLDISSVNAYAYFWLWVPVHPLLWAKSGMCRDFTGLGKTIPWVSVYSQSDSFFWVFSLINPREGSTQQEQRRRILLQLCEKQHPNRQIKEVGPPITHFWYLKNNLELSRKIYFICCHFRWTLSSDVKICFYICFLFSHLQVLCNYWNLKPTGFRKQSWY